MGHNIIIIINVEIQFSISIEWYTITQTYEKLFSRKLYISQKKKKTLLGQQIGNLS